MDLISAIKSGKPFKRKDWDLYLRIVEGEIKYEGNGRDHAMHVSVALADDWEIQEEKIKLTAEQIRSAILHATHDLAFNELITPTIIKKLGFKE